MIHGVIPASLVNMGLERHVVILERMEDIAVYWLRSSFGDRIDHIVNINGNGWIAT